MSPNDYLTDDQSECLRMADDSRNRAIKATKRSPNILYISTAFKACWNHSPQLFGMATVLDSRLPGKSCACRVNRLTKEPY